MKRLRLVRHQFRYDLLSYIREPTAVFFSALLPIMFLILFVGVFGNEDVPSGAGHHVKGSTYFVPSILALAIISATAVNLAISISIARERGTLKRLRSTPLPPSVVLMARVCTQVSVVSLISVVVIAFGRFVYGVSLPTSAWPALIITLLVGIASFCCVGFAMTLIIRSEEAAPAVANAVTLPLNFMSGVFFPRGTVPKWMGDIASAFPVKHLVDALFKTFDPSHIGSRFSANDLLVLGAWGVGSLILSSRFFRWTPRNK